MKGFVVCAFVALGAATAMAKSPPKPADFSGTWVLDTSQLRNPPLGLESYTMKVSQSSQQLAVETTLKGDVRPNLSETYPAGPGGPNGPGGPRGSDYPGGPRGGIYGGGGIGGMGRMGRSGLPGGGGPMSEGIPGGGMPGTGTGSTVGGSSRGERGRDTSGAFVYYPAKVTYPLSGGTTTAEFGGPTHGQGSAKATWTKNRQELKMSIDGNDYSSPQGGSLLLKDQWRLSKDGQSLFVDRTVRNGRRSSTVSMVFEKQATSSGGARKPLSQ